MNVYEIRVKGHLDQHWSAWFEGLTISHDDDGNTVLRGALVDEAVARLWLSLARKAPVTLTVSIEDVNGSPAALLWMDDALYSVVTFDVLDGKIKTIRTVLNPDKLAYIEQQLAG